MGSAQPPRWPACRPSPASGRRRDRPGPVPAVRRVLKEPLFFVLGTDEPGREAEVFRRADRRWQAVIDLLGPLAERIEVPYRKGVTLPAYFFRPDRSHRRRPTLIINNGSDGINIEMYGSYGARAALARGYNVLIFEGPGQGSMLFERQIMFTPRWADVIRPLVRYLRGRDDVDRKRIALMGISFGGLLISRAAPRVNGLAALVLNPGWLNYVRSWRDPETARQVRQCMRAPRAQQRVCRRAVNAAFGQAELPFAVQFELAKRAESMTRQALRDARRGRRPSNYYGVLKAVLRYSATRALPKIDVPTLVIGNKQEQDMPVGDTKRAFDLLTTKSKKYVEFSAAQGAGGHDQPMAPQLQNEVILDWLDGVLKRCCTPQCAPARLLPRALSG